MRTRTAAGLVVVALGLAAPLAALAQPVQRTTLQEQSFPGPVNHTVLMRAEIAPGGEVAPHTHPGVEMTYVARGAALLEIAGRPESAPATASPCRWEGSTAFATPVLPR